MSVADVGEAMVVVAGVVAQTGEGLFHVQPLALGDHALGLLDHDATVQGVVELLVDDLGAARRVVLEDGDGGHIGQGLGGDHIVGEQRPGSLRNRLSAPMTWRRNRIGMASAPRKPASRATGANSGHAAR